jgi:hypothetical protein
VLAIMLLSIYLKPFGWVLKKWAKKSILKPENFETYQYRK